MKVMTIVGTRPEMIKLSRVIAELDRCTRHVLVHTGQNYDDELSKVFFEDLEIRPPDHYLGAAGDTAAETISQVISKIDPVLEKEQPDAVLLYGDTNSCLTAIAAKRRKIPVFHMEAGNRCFDERVPEEINRRIIDHISDINMPLTEHARRYLIAEGIRPEAAVSGAKGNYTEDDFEDAGDLYGRSKLMGEVAGPHAVTLRTSIIGLELDRQESLVEWFLSQRGNIQGYTQAIYSGFTTQEMARIIEFILLKHSSLSGLWHVASAPISKYDLLKKLGDCLNRNDIKIEPSDELDCDRSLNASQFLNATGYRPPSWDKMLKELAQQIQERNHFTG